jgi:signal transduction histidine kinase
MPADRNDPGSGRGRLMKTIGAKISIAVYVIAASAFFFASYAYQDYIKMSAVQDGIHLSLHLRGYARDIENKDMNADIFNYFKKVKQSVHEPERLEAMSNLVQALNTKNKQLRILRFKEFQEAESKFYRSNISSLGQYKVEFQKNVFFAILSPLFGLLMFSIYLRRSIVHPLQKLSQRMMDFMVDRYTFKLSTPANNEIGDLQRTFNSLAQRVLNNMDELKALDRAKSEFVSIASHELRTPLTSIKGSLGILSSGMLGGELEPEAKGLIRIAEQETDRLVRLINNLLDLAKMESRTFSLKKDWVPVLGLAESSLESLIGLAQTAQVTLEIQHPEETIESSMDRDRIQQVITNLMSNAIKYSPKNKSVVLSYYITPENFLEISVTDKGPGIPVHDQELIFEKFRQGTQAESKLVKGTGLGLAISKALVEEHGGTLGLRSQEGRGSTFYFTIPEWRVAPHTKTNSSFGVAA